MDWCETNRLDYVFGLAPNSTLRRHITGLGKHRGALQGRADRRQGPPLQGILRRRQDLEPGPPLRRPRRGRQRRHRHPLHRHQPRPRQRPVTVPAPLLRPGGEPHQGLENPSRRRPHLVPQGHRQRRRLLAAVASAHADAQALVLAGRPVRHPRATPDQDRRPHRRDENQDQSPSANPHSRSSGLAFGSRPPAAADHLNTGAGPPRHHPIPPTPSPITHQPPPTSGPTRHARTQPKDETNRASENANAPRRIKRDRWRIPRAEGVEGRGDDRPQRVEAGGPVGARTMLARTRERLGLRPNRLAADTAYGSGWMLGWLVGQNIAPRIPVWDKSQRDDGTLSRASAQRDRHHGSAWRRHHPNSRLRWDLAAAWPRGRGVPAQRLIVTGGDLTAAISVIIPTLNEAARLPLLLAAIARGKTPHEVIVVDGGSADGTLELALNLGARILRAPGGRGAQLAAGAEAATGDVLLFLHADTVFPEGGLAAIVSALAASPDCIGGNFRLLFDGGDRFSRWLAGFYHWLRRRRLYYGDSGIFVRQDSYRAAGGIRPDRPDGRLRLRPPYGAAWPNRIRSKSAVDHFVAAVCRAPCGGDRLRLVRHSCALPAQCLARPAGPYLQVEPPMT